jgi:hypothetical protein
VRVISTAASTIISQRRCHYPDLDADNTLITVMEVAGNAARLAVPGAMDVGLAAPLFWASLASRP